MTIAFVVSNLTYPPREGLHQQSIVTALLLKTLYPELDLLGFVRDPSALDQQAMARDIGLSFAVPPVHTHLPDILLALLNQYVPMSLRSRAVRRLHASLDRYRTIHLENVGAVGLVRPALRRRAILSLIDPGTLRWRRFAQAATSVSARWSARLKGLLHLILERRVVVAGAAIHVVSAPDAAYLRARYPAVRVEDIPVALPPAMGEYPPAAVPATPTIVVFLDLRQDYLRRSFLWFARTVMPLCACAATIKLVVLGRVVPDAELLAATSAFDTEFVAWAEDHRTVLAQASVVVMPDRLGTGLKNRVLEAIALGRPVVGTSVAFEGIPVDSDREAIVADEPRDMAHAIDRLIADPSAAAAIAQAGRHRILGVFGAEVVAGRWRRFYDGPLSTLANRPKDVRGHSAT